MRTISLTVTEQQAGRTVRGLLSGELKIAPSLVSRIKLRPRGICLNGERVNTNVRVRAGDVLTADVSDIEPRNEAAPCDIELRFLYEDEDLAIIEKPAGLAVHAPRGDTVAGALARLWGAGCAFHPVNRLDMDTSGLMTVAKSGYIHDRLRRLLHGEGFLREYTALCEGLPSPAAGVISLPVSPVPDKAGRRAVSQDGLACVTHYETLAAGDGHALLRVRLETGRTHQIRVHFSASGHPLAGDGLYGGGTDLIPRQALHSAKIELIQPVTGEIIRACCPPPEDFCRAAQAAGIKYP